MSRADIFEFTLDEDTEKRLFEILTGMDTRNTNRIWLTDKCGYNAEYVKVMHGEWLPKHHYIAGHEFVSGHICSECGDDALNAEGDEFLTDYCPNCGAKMDARKEE